MTKKYIKRLLVLSELGICDLDKDILKFYKIFNGERSNFKLQYDSNVKNVTIIRDDEDLYVARIDSNGIRIFAASKIFDLFVLNNNTDKNNIESLLAAFIEYKLHDIDDI